jgi:protein-disulfide isomerase
MKAVISCLLVALLSPLGSAFAQQKTGSAQSTGRPPVHESQTPMPAAKIGDDVITVEELERMVSIELTRIEEQRYALLSQKLEELIDARLLADEAARRGVTVDQLLKSQAQAAAPPVTEADVTAFISQNRKYFSGVPDDEVRLRVWGHLRAAKIAEARKAYVKLLWARNNVSIHLNEPRVLRVHVNPDEGYFNGGADARVAIVEFSDFQCPFCKAVLPVLRRVLDKYGPRVKLVFRDFPITTIHPTVFKAHEAARCAGAQGRFWEYHDLLFERSPRHSPSDLKQYAQELRLDGTAFAACLDSGRHEADVNRDLEVGTRLGISGTPTFFVNGRVLVGALPLETFESVIESELAAAQSRASSR